MNLSCISDDDIEDLNEQLIGIQQTRELEKEQAHATIKQIKTELQETKDQLTSDNMILGNLLRISGWTLLFILYYYYHRSKILSKSSLDYKYTTD